MESPPPEPQRQRRPSPDSAGRLQQLELEAAELRAQLATLVALVRAAWAGSQDATDQLADVVNWTGQSGDEGSAAAAPSALVLSEDQKDALRRRVTQLEELLSHEELRAAWDTQRRRVSFRPASGSPAPGWRDRPASSVSPSSSGGSGGVRVRDLVRLPGAGTVIPPATSAAATRVRPPPQQPTPHTPPHDPGDLFDPQSLMARASARVQSACPPPATPVGGHGGRQRPRTGGPAERRRPQPPHPHMGDGGPSGVSVVGERPLKFERMEGGAGRQQGRLTSVRLGSAAAAATQSRKRPPRAPQLPGPDRLSADVASAEQRGGQLESEFDRVMLDLQRKLGLDTHGLV